MAQDNTKYTKPELRESIKDRVMAGSSECIRFEVLTHTTKAMESKDIFK